MTITYLKNHGLGTHDVLPRQYAGDQKAIERLASDKDQLNWINQIQIGVLHVSIWELGRCLGTQNRIEPKQSDLIEAKLEAHETSL